MEPINAEKAQKILQEKGLTVSLEQAIAILNFLNNLANIAISVYLLPDNEYPANQPVKTKS